MTSDYYSINKAAELFGAAHMKSDLSDYLEQGEVPETKRFRSGAIFKKGWHLSDIPKVGEKIGFFKKFDRPVSMAIFTTKGGVLKSTLALNTARVAALHNLKTCVVGLDIQGDVTTALGFENDIDDGEDLGQLLEKLGQSKGLSDFFNGQVRLNEIITPTDIPNLFLVPETPELVALNDSLSNINRREFWLKEKVIDPLKEYFDLVIMDCSPNWNKLTTNALVASDVLLSPLECKINNFRNFKVFRHFLSEFKRDMNMNFENIFVPTKFSSNRKLSLEIKNWYMENVEGCTEYGVREGVLGEEAIALNLSLLEYAPKKPASVEMRNLLCEVHLRTEDYLSKLPEQENKLLGRQFIGKPSIGEDVARC